MKRVAELLNEMLRAAVDYARVLALREAGAIADGGISELAERYGLAAEWRSFRERFDER